MRQTFEKVGELFISPTTFLYKWKSEKKNFLFLQSLLNENEEIKLCFQGNESSEKKKLDGILSNTGLILITSERLLIGSHVWGSKTFNELKFTKETNIEGQGFLSGVLGSGWFHIKNTNHEIWISGLNGGRKQVDQILEVLKEVISKLNTETNSVTNSNQSSDNLDKIKKLKELLDMGVLNQQEFDDKKNELLKDI